MGKGKESCDDEIKKYNAWIGLHIPIFASNLKITSGFSLLVFLPTPSKMLYWLKYRRRFQQLLIDPPALRYKFGIEGVFQENHFGKWYVSSKVWKIWDFGNWKDFP